MRYRLVALLLALVALATACTDDDGPSAQQLEAKARQDSYTRLQAAQPAKTMGYSPTRESINFWIETWDAPKKLSFVYLLAANGQMIGYYVFEGLPVSYCAALTPTYEFINPSADHNGNAFNVPAPSVDGVYYSGGQCSQYFGRDATTGTYLEFSTGSGINFLVYEEPIPRPDVAPLGFTKIEDVRP